MTAPKHKRARKADVAARMRGKVQREISWPTQEWANDPVKFAYDVLGVAWLSERQQGVLRSIYENDYTTIRGGRKSGKTRAVMLAAWWYVCTFPEARVFLVAPTLPSVTQITWRDITRLHQQAPVRLGGDLHTNPLTGWVDGLRGIYGRVSRDAGGIRGISDPNVMYVVDEASDVKDEIFETIDGNVAGGMGQGRHSKVVLISNPTELIGFFHESHTRDSRFARHHMPAEAQNARPGMASEQWILAQQEKHGKESDYYQIHIEGNFPSTDNVRYISETLLEAAESAWDITPADDVGLVLGLDPAFSSDNDEAGFALRRGRKILRIEAVRGQDEHSLTAIALAMIQEEREGTEPIRIVVDGQGPVGQRTFDALRPMCTKFGFQLTPLYWRSFQQWYPKLAKAYGNIDAARWGFVADFLRDDGVLPYDKKLHDELLFAQRSRGNDGRMLVQHKDEFKEALKRSPDRADAVLNCCWQYGVAQGAGFVAVQVAEQQQSSFAAAGAARNPYGLIDSRLR